MSTETPAAGVLRRVLGDAADEFDLQLVSGSGLDEFEVGASGGKCFVTASSTVALCRGAYHYVRATGLGQLSWSGGPISLPNSLPDFPTTRVVSAVRARHYLSVCTYGYSAPWWDWVRWEAELDWMALHGINMPLLLSGTEAISRRAFRAIGLTEDEIANHFSGPAYLCWHRLGNLNGHMGPLPESWIVGQEKLQRKILDRARELGMSPIVQGFSGFVPNAAQRIWPNVKLQSAEHWAGFEPTTYLDPREPAFQMLAKVYYKEFRRAYGAVHHFLCEVFAEQLPCLNEATELEDLRQIGSATWNALFRSDPDANWVMQGWPFYFAREYWRPERTAALLQSVPFGRAIVLDLATDELETWRLQPAMREKGWSFNVVHNYGGNTPLHGDLQGYIDRADKALYDPGRGLMQGMGISPEGIDQNSAVYELLTDLMWSTEKPNLSDWVPSYAHARYGKPGGEKAWKLMAESIYGPELPPNPRFSWRFRPGDQPLTGSHDPSVLYNLLEAFLRIEGTLGDSSNYRRDLVDVAKTWLGALADRFLERALSGDRSARERFFELLGDIEAVLSTRPEHRLSTWLRAARNLGTNKAEADHYDRNARSLLTWWGGPFLFDYATREWAGLVGSFHSERWRLWFDWLDGKKSPPDFASWERGWAERTGIVDEGPLDSEIEVIERLFAKYSPFEFGPDPQLQVSRFQSRYSETIEVELTQRAYAVACIPVFGQGFGARYSVEVSSDGEVWDVVDTPAGPEVTYKGFRATLGANHQRVRFKIDIVQGAKDQSLQIVIWERARASERV